MFVIVLVIIQESLNQFEAEFVDTHTCRRYTVTFWRGEPVLYHPPHLAKPVFTHINCIADGYFIVGSSTTGRMIPFTQAQQVLQFKLNLTDIERELHGSDLDSPEKLLWRQWVDGENQRARRKSRVRAPCCGRYTYRYQLEADDNGQFWCMHCWSTITYLCNATEICTPRVTDIAADPDYVSPNPNEPSAKHNEPSEYPWRRKESDGDLIAPPPKRHCAPSSGVVEQCSSDGGCYLATFDGAHEKVLIYQKDMLGVPAAGEAVEVFMCIALVRAKVIK